MRRGRPRRGDRIIDRHLEIVNLIGVLVQPYYLCNNPYEIAFRPEQEAVRTRDFGKRDYVSAPTTNLGHFSHRKRVLGLLTTVQDHMITALHEDNARYIVVGRKEHAGGNFLGVPQT